VQQDISIPQSPFPGVGYGTTAEVNPVVDGEIIGSSSGASSGEDGDDDYDAELADPETAILPQVEISTSTNRSEDRQDPVVDDLEDVTLEYERQDEGPQEHDAGVANPLVRPSAAPRSLSPHSERRYITDRRAMGVTTTPLSDSSRQQGTQREGKAQVPPVNQRQTVEWTRKGNSRPRRGHTTVDQRPSASRQTTHLSDWSLHHRWGEPSQSWQQSRSVGHATPAQLGDARSQRRQPNQGPAEHTTTKRRVVWAEEEPVRAPSGRTSTNPRNHPVDNQRELRVAGVLGGAGRSPPDEPSDSEDSSDENWQNPRDQGHTNVRGHMAAQPGGAPTGGGLMVSRTNNQQDKWFGAKMRGQTTTTMADQSERFRMPARKEDVD
jgi:hypothetical protein